MAFFVLLGFVVVIAGAFIYLLIRHIIETWRREPAVAASLGNQEQSLTTLPAKTPEVMDAKRNVVSLGDFTNDNVDQFINDLLVHLSSAPVTYGGIAGYLEMRRKKARLKSQVEYLDLVEKQSAKIVQILTNAVTIREKLLELRNLLREPATRVVQLEPSPPPISSDHIRLGKKLPDD